MSDDEHALEFHLVSNLLKKRQQHIIHNQESVFRMIGYVAELIGMQPEIQCVQHSTRCRTDGRP